MKSICLIFLVSLAWLSSSCSTHRMSGELDNFLVAEIRRYGGNAGIHEKGVGLGGRWIYERDRFGTVIRSGDVKFEALDQFLKLAYGAPSKAGTTSEQQQQWVIPAKSAGVSIWYSKLDDGVGVTVLSSLKVPKEVAK